MFALGCIQTHVRARTHQHRTHPPQNTQQKCKKNSLVWVLQRAAFLLFSLAYVSVLDYFAFMLDCKWTHIRTAPMHNYFEEQSECAVIVFWRAH